MFDIKKFKKMEFVYIDGDHTSEDAKQDIELEAMPKLKVMDLAPRDDRKLAFEFCKEYADILEEEVQVQDCGCMYVDEHVEGVHWDRVLIATCLKCEWKETLLDSNYFTNTNLSLGGLR